MVVAVHRHAVAQHESRNSVGVELAGHDRWVDILAGKVKNQVYIVRNDHIRQFYKSVLAGHTIAPDNRSMFSLVR